jgi:hypothetical protein
MKAARHSNELRVPGRIFSGGSGDAARPYTPSAASVRHRSAHQIRPRALSSLWRAACSAPAGKPQPREARTVTSEIIDSRLAFLARCAARLTLIEAGEIDLDEALDGLSPCESCRRLEWVEALVARWERTHPPLKYRGQR